MLLNQTGNLGHDSLDLLKYGWTHKNIIGQHCSLIPNESVASAVQPLQMVHFSVCVLWHFLVCTLWLLRPLVLVLWDCHSKPCQTSN